MKTAKNICFCVILAVVIFCLQNIDGRRCSKNYTCPNTTTNISNANQMERLNAFRQFVREALTSRFIPSLSGTGRRFINCILSHLNTDSPSLLNTFSAFIIYTFPYIVQIDSTPPLCMFALNINGSRRWAENRDGNSAANGLLNTAQSVSTYCQMLEFTSLTEIGCNNVPEPPPLPRNCTRRGYVYDIIPILNLFGQNLPCCLYDGVLDLYDLTTYPEKLLAAGFTVALTPEAQYMVGAVDVNLLLEMYNMVLNNNVSTCCCPKRRARYDVICAVVNVTVYNNVFAVINDTYLYDQCATEAYYP